MHFIISHFIQMMKNFGLEMVVRYYKTENYYEILFHDLPVELDMRLVTSHYNEYIGKRVVRVNPKSKDMRTKEEEVFADEHVVIPIEFGHSSYTKIVLNEYDYAKKINFVYREIFDYYHNLPLSKWHKLPVVDMK